MDIPSGDKVIHLVESQVSHFLRLYNLLKKRHGYFDFSMTGAGKTVCALAIAAVFKLDIFLVTEKTIIPQWYDEANKYEVNIPFSISYQSLRGMKNCDLNHDFLIRTDSGGQRNKVEFEATAKFYEWLDAGILLVFDEFAALKNESEQSKAARALINALFESNSRSRFACLSAIPIEKEDHALTLCRNIGFITEKKLYNYNQYTGMDLKGLQELIDHCNRIDPYNTQVTIDRLQDPKDFKNSKDPREFITKENARSLVFQLFINVIKMRMSSTAKRPFIEAKLDIKNGYYKMEPEDEELLMKGVQQIRVATNYEQYGYVDLVNTNWSSILESMPIVEASKVNILARIARRDLTENPNCKVILYMTYKNSINRLAQQLTEFLPLLLDGDTKMGDRELIKHLFQNDPRYRLLIGSIRVGKAGLNLDDTTGEYPRIMYIVPTYSIHDTQNAAGRCYRVTTASDTKVRYVYGQAATVESKLLDALSRKTDIVKEVLDEQVKEGILFPGDFENEYEE